MGWKLSTALTIFSGANPDGPIFYFKIIVVWMLTYWASSHYLSTMVASTQLQILFETSSGVPQHPSFYSVGYFILCING